MKYIYKNITLNNQSVILASKNQATVGVKTFSPGASLTLDYPGLDQYVGEILLKREVPEPGDIVETPVVISEPVVVVEEPVVVVEEPVVEEHPFIGDVVEMVEEPVVEEPVVEEPVVEEPIVEEPVVEEEPVIKAAKLKIKKR